MLHPLFHRAALPALFATAGLAAAGCWSPAEAAKSCTGNLSTSSLHKLPAPLVVGLQNGVANSSNPQLAGLFVAGLQRAGITVSDQSNATLNLAVSVVPPASSGQQSSIVSGSYKGFDWAGGNRGPNMPRPPAIRGSTLSLSVTLTDNAVASLSWIATLQCKVQTDDSGVLAGEMGELIGRTIGQSNDSKRI